MPVAFVRKILHIGFFLFLVASWPTLTATVLNGFVWAGKTAGGGTTVSLQDPSSVISAGFDAVQPISNKVSELVAPHWWSALANMDQLIWYGLSMIITLVAFCVIGVQCFIAYLEFYIVAVLMLIMVPFGIFRHTAFLSEKAIGAIISHGVKLMVLAFIIAAAAPIFAAITPPNDPTITVAICTALGSVAIMLLAWHAPSLASGMLSGGPSLTAGTAAGAAIGVAAGAAALGAGAIGAGAMAGKAASGTASATIKAAGALSEGARMGAASMAAGGGAGYSEMAAGAAGGMMQVAGNAAVQPIRSGVAKAGDAMRQKFNDGRLTGYKYMGVRPTTQPVAADQQLAHQRLPLVRQARPPLPRHLPLPLRLRKPRRPAHKAPTAQPASAPKQWPLLRLRPRPRLRRPPRRPRRIPPLPPPRPKRRLRLPPALPFRRRPAQRLPSAARSTRYRQAGKPSKNSRAGAAAAPASSRHCRKTNPSTNHGARYPCQQRRN
ncbi:P-type conjugative transfer protein TrbL [Xanthomonas theicola]|uniref:P-type conjugative transfer protein TrbL n=1 Tax=Xanthomonas theicola TaxID=56464 RepID=UPI0036064C66